MGSRDGSAPFRTAGCSILEVVDLGFSLLALRPNNCAVFTSYRVAVGLTSSNDRPCQVVLSDFEAVNVSVVGLRSSTKLCITNDNTIINFEDHNVCERDWICNAASTASCNSHRLVRAIDPQAYMKHLKPHTVTSRHQIILQPHKP